MVLGSGNSFKGRLVLQIVTDIVFIVQFKVSDGSLQRAFKVLPQIPFFGKKAVPVPESIAVRHTMRGIVAGDVGHASVVQEHQPHYKGDHFALHHDKRHDDVSVVAQPDPIIFRGQEIG